MKIRLLCLLPILVFVSINSVQSQDIFDIEPSQSMLMTGKGAGQDATMNPFYGQDCYAVIDNIGEASFSVRIQSKGEVIKESTIDKGQTRKLVLLKGHELYLDPIADNKSRARVSYLQIE